MINEFEEGKNKTIQSCITMPLFNWIPICCSALAIANCIDCMHACSWCIENKVKSVQFAVNCQIKGNSISFLRCLQRKSFQVKINTKAFIYQSVHVSQMQTISKKKNGSPPNSKWIRMCTVPNREYIRQAHTIGIFSVSIRKDLR